MKYVSATEARQNWFKLLDEAAKGEVIAIQRNDKQLVLRLHKQKTPVPNYKRLLRVSQPEDADTWGWEWTPSKGLKSVKR
jgi:hypothetical protein